MTPMNEVTQILSGIVAGDPHAADQLKPLVYEELRKLAAQNLSIREADAALGISTACWRMRPRTTASCPEVSS
jgi:hypothetical protein